MTRSILFSIIFHAGMIVLTALSLPFMMRDPIDLPPILSVELIQITDQTSIPFAAEAAKTLEKIKEEKQKGTKIFVETCPHYLTLSHETQTGYLAKVMPPIRTKNDMESVWTAIQSNEIDTIGTDHVANQLKLKRNGDDVWSALAGFPGIGTSLPILLSEGVNKNKINLSEKVSWL